MNHQDFDIPKIKYEKVEIQIPTPEEMEDIQQYLEEHPPEEIAAYSRHIEPPLDKLKRVASSVWSGIKAVGGGGFVVASGFVVIPLGFLVGIPRSIYYSLARSIRALKYHDTFLAALNEGKKGLVLEFLFPVLSAVASTTTAFDSRTNLNVFGRKLDDLYEEKIIPRFQPKIYDADYFINKKCKLIKESLYNTIVNRFKVKETPNFLTDMETLIRKKELQFVKEADITEAIIKDLTKSSLKPAEINCALCLLYWNQMKKTIDSTEIKEYSDKIFDLMNQTVDSHVPSMILSKNTQEIINAIIDEVTKLEKTRTKVDTIIKTMQKIPVKAIKDEVAKTVNEWKNSHIESTEEEEESAIKEVVLANEDIEEEAAEKEVVLPNEGVEDYIEEFVLEAKKEVKRTPVRIGPLAILNHLEKRLNQLELDYQRALDKSSFKPERMRDDIIQMVKEARKHVNHPDFKVQANASTFLFLVKINETLPKEVTSDAKKMILEWQLSDMRDKILKMNKDKTSDPTRKSQEFLNEINDLNLQDQPRHIRKLVLQNITLMTKNPKQPETIQKACVKLAETLKDTNAADLAKLYLIIVEKEFMKIADQFAKQRSSLNAKSIGQFVKDKVAEIKNIKKITKSEKIKKETDRVLNDMYSWLDSLRLPNNVQKIVDESRID